MLIADEWNKTFGISIKDIIDTLNELVETDRDFVNTLISTRFPCNDKLRDHKSVQVSSTIDANNEEIPMAGFLGVLNGIIGIDRNKYGAVCAVFDDNNKIKEFKMIETKEFDKK
jgi:hypothetical protein